MARSFYPPEAENTSEAKFYHKPSESYFEMLRRDGKFYQRRYQIGHHGQQTNVEEKEAHYVMGSGNHVRTYIHRTARNTLVELPLAWHAEKGGYWAMNPGYDRADHESFRRKISFDCMFCHNAYPEAVPASYQVGKDPVFPERMPSGIDCQRCHGPGGAHLLAAQKNGSDVRGTIVNPVRLSPERQMEVCMQCHLATTSFRLPNSIQRYERGPFSYRPGEPLGDFIIHFDHAPGSGREDKFEIVSSAYRLRRSACYLRSNGALRCTTCHNPHDIPRGPQVAQRYEAICLRCHDVALAKMQHASRGCIDCHMPKRRADDVVHAVMTDHLIQLRKPAGDLIADRAERHETEATAYHGEVKLYYPETNNELYLAVAQVAQKSNLEAGVPRLAAAIEKYRPQLPEFYFELADAYRNIGENEKAIRFYEEALRHKPDFVAALRKLGAMLRITVQYARAAETLNRALQVDASDAGSWHELGLVHQAEGRKSEAAAPLEKAVEADPDSAEAWNTLGGLRMEAGNRNGAEAAFRYALRVQPGYAEAHNNLANLLAYAGDLPQARYHFEAALRRRPDYGAARFNYATALAANRQYDDAERQVAAALAADPGMEQAHELFGNLLARKGHIDDAARHYEAALRLRPDFGRAHLGLGTALAAMGNTGAALPHLRKAAEAPEPEIRQQALELLKRLGSTQE